jgi:hypothetical protein
VLAVARGERPRPLSSVPQTVAARAARVQQNLSEMVLTPAELASRPPLDF